METSQNKRGKTIQKNKANMKKKKQKGFIKKTSIKGLYIIERPTYLDERGFFHEILRLSDLKDYGIDFKPVQWSHSQSKPGVIRAIHSEKWQKVVYAVTGKVYAAFVDVRPESDTFGKIETMTFDRSKKDSPHKAVYVPPGIGNSLCAMGKETVNYIYLVDEYWDNSKAQGIAWNDPDLNIDWPVKKPIISERDKNNPTMRELFPKKYKR